MDAGDFFYVILFLLWALSQIAGVIKKSRQKQERTEAPRRPPPRTSTPPELPLPREGMDVESAGEGLLANLNALEREIEQTLPGLDGAVAAQVEFLVEKDFRPLASALRRDLRNAEFEPARARQQVAGLLAYYRGLLQTARVHTSLRRRPELQKPRAIADGLAAAFDEPRRVANPLPSPVAIIGEVSADDRLRESALADATLFIPRTVIQDPSHWSFLAPEMARYLGASAPSLYQEIYAGLELGASEAEVGNDPQALTRVLYASWIGRFVADAVGALFFGPAYLRSIAELYAQPQAPARVTSIVVDSDGSVHAEPPAHVRLHVTARWLTRMGYASEASQIRRGWDERHGSPEVLGFWGSLTSLPAAPVLDAAAELTDDLYQLPLNAFGGVRLAHVPGLADWERRDREFHAAKARLRRGDAAAGSVRALVAAAIEAALEAPAEATKIHEALVESMTAPSRAKVAAAPRTTTRPVAPVAVRARGAFQDLTGADVAEALILSEILLVPRGKEMGR